MRAPEGEAGSTSPGARLRAAANRVVTAIRRKGESPAERGAHIGDPGDPSQDLDFRVPSVRLANLALAALAREWEQHETSNPDSDVSGSGSCSSHSTCDLPANTEESMALANATLAMHAVSALAASVNAHANAVVVAKTLDRKDDAAHLHELNNNMKLMRQARVLAGATATAAENKARHWYGKQNEVARGENGKAHPV